jgi:hypothetical protein
MTPEELKKLTGYYHTLRTEQRQLEDEAKTPTYLDQTEFAAFSEEIYQIEKDR